MKINKPINPFGIIDIEEGEIVIIKRDYVTILSEKRNIPIIHQSYGRTLQEVYNEVIRLNN